MSLVVAIDPNREKKEKYFKSIKISEENTLQILK